MGRLPHRRTPVMTSPSTPPMPSPHQTGSPDSIPPWLIFGFVLAVLVIVVGAVAVGVDNDSLTAITGTTVAIVAAAVAAFKVRR